MDYDPPLEKVCLGRDAAVVCTMGRCVNDTCMDCAPGWKHGTSFYHLENCSEPIVFVTILGSLGIITCVILEYYLFFRLMRSKAAVRVVLGAAQGTNVSMFGAFVSLLAQGYSGIPFWFFLGLASIFVAISLTTTILSYLRIVFKVANRAFPETLGKVVFRLSLSALIVPFMGIIFPMSCYAMYSDPALYNLGVAVGVMFVPLQLVVTGPILAHATKKLAQEVEKSANMDRLNGIGSYNRTGSKQTMTIGQDSSQRDSSNVAKSQDGTPIGRLLRRLKIFRYSMYLVIIPSELLMIGMLALMYLVWRLSMDWVVLTIAMITLQSCTYVFTFSSADAKQTSSKAKSSIGSSPRRNQGGAAGGDSKGMDTTAEISPYVGSFAGGNPA